MSGNHAELNDDAVPSVEPAPDIDVSVRFNGQLQRTTIRAGKSKVLSFGNFPMQIEIERVKRHRTRPVGKPPYYWIIKTASWSDRIRSMSEENARRLFYRRFGTDEDIVEIYPEIS